MSTRCDEVQIAANSGLSRVDVAEVVGAVDDPEVLITRGEFPDWPLEGRTSSTMRVS